MGALALLMLYLFISLPVQLWHHHHDVKQNVTAVKNYKVTADNSLQNERCKICKHTYSPYVDPYPVFTIEPIAESTFKKCTFVPTFPDVFIFQLSNKSPPAV